MNTIVTIDGTDYDDDAFAGARVVQSALSLTLDGNDSFSWVEQGCGPVPAWKEWMTVAVAIDGTARFAGRIKKVQRDSGGAGWQYAYTAVGKKGLAETVPVRSRDGSGEACYDMPPAVDDPSYIPSLVGLTVGQIIADVLTIPATAQALDDLGIGGYTGLPTTPALHATTMSDLAALDIVPRGGVCLTGLGVLNQLQGLVAQWHRRFLLYVRPDGVIRFFDVTDMPLGPMAISVPGDDGGGDDVDWPQHDRDIDGCYSRVQVVGRDIRAAYLSTKDGTLTSLQGNDTSFSPTNAPSWSLVNEAAWRYSDFAQPRDAFDAGTLSGVTLTGCTVTSSDTTKNWPSNFWNGRQARIYLILDAGGAQFTEVRTITTTAALSAGGTATIGWDSSVPLQNVGYTRYRIAGLTGPLALVGREFLVRDKSSGDTGLNTFIGAHLATAFPNPVSWGTSVARTLTSTPVGAVYWSIDGTATGYNSITIPIEINPTTGGLVAGYPIALPSAGQARLERGWPTGYAQGKPTDFQAVVPYNAGDLEATYPASGFAGRAYADLGMERTMFIPMPRWTWVGDTADVLKFATEIHKSVCDPVDSGAITFHGTPAFAFLALGYSVAMALSDGSPSEWDGLELAARSVTLEWPPAGSPDVTRTTIQFSNECRPFDGDPLLMHAAYSDIPDGDSFAIGAGFGQAANPYDPVARPGAPGFDPAGSGVYGAGGPGVFGPDKPGSGMFGAGADDPGAGLYGARGGDPSAGVFGADPSDAFASFFGGGRGSAPSASPSAPSGFVGPPAPRQDAIEADAGAPIVISDPPRANLSERRRANGRREDDILEGGG